MSKKIDQRNSDTVRPLISAPLLSVVLRLNLSLVHPTYMKYSKTSIIHSYIARHYYPQTSVIRGFVDQK